MNLQAALADLNLAPQVTNPQFLLTIAAGIVAGLGVVGALHYLIRPRMLVPPRKAPRPEVPDPFVDGSALEQRKSVRREGNPVEVLVVSITTGACHATGYVIDRCMGGLRLYVNGPVEVGKHLNVRPTNAPSITPWVEIIVTNCCPSSQGYELGCQFLRTPPWAILMMFG